MNKLIIYAHTLWILWVSILENGYISTFIDNCKRILWIKLWKCKKERRTSPFRAESDGPIPQVAGGKVNTAGQEGERILEKKEHLPHVFFRKKNIA